MTPWLRVTPVVRARIATARFWGNGKARLDDTNGFLARVIPAAMGAGTEAQRAAFEEMGK
jgi:hypothetical protein